MVRVGVSAVVRHGPQRKTSRTEVGTVPNVNEYEAPPEFDFVQLEKVSTTVTSPLDE